MRAIDGDALGLTDMEIIMCNGNYKEALKMLLYKIDHAPTIEPERKTGRWEMLQIPISPPIYKCSVCGGHALQTVTGCLVNRHLEANLTDFCSNCGADMRGEQNG